MGDIKHLQGKEAIKKMKEMVKSIDTCMFCTDVDKVPFPSRPMSTQEVDDDGNFWFFSSKSSHKNQEINADSKVQLIFANAGKTEYLSVYGKAAALYDRAKVDELWNPFIKTWFQEGKDDPDLTLIKVTPEDSYYWDTKDGRIVTLLKIAAGAITGKEMDGSIEGKMNV